MKAYLLALFLDRVKVGDEYTGPLPLHCTLVPWFTVPDKFVELTNALEDEFKRYSFVELHSARPALYGKDHAVPVHELTKTAKLLSIHGPVLILMSYFNITHLHPEWIGRHWSPHVTDLGERRFLTGLHATVSKVSLVETEHATNRKLKRILKQFDLDSH